MIGHKEAEGYSYTLQSGEEVYAENREIAMRLCPVLGKMSLEEAGVLLELAALGNEEEDKKNETSDEDSSALGVFTAPSLFDETKGDIDIFGLQKDSSPIEPEEKVVTEEVSSVETEKETPEPKVEIVKEKSEPFLEVDEKAPNEVEPSLFAPKDIIVPEPIEKKGPKKKSIVKEPGTQESNFTTDETNTHQTVANKTEETKKPIVETVERALEPTVEMVVTEPEISISSEEVNGDAVADVLFFEPKIKASDDQHVVEVLPKPENELAPPIRNVAIVEALPKPVYKKTLPLAEKIVEEDKESTTDEPIQVATPSASDVVEKVATITSPTTEIVEKVIEESTEITEATLALPASEEKVVASTEELLEEFETEALDEDMEKFSHTVEEMTLEPTEEDEEEKQAIISIRTSGASGSTVVKQKLSAQRLIGMFATLLHIEYKPV